MEDQEIARWYIIVNPKAANGKIQKKLSDIRAFLFAALGDAVWVLTQNQGHATLLAQAAIKQGYRKLLAVGGDGTSNEVINGILIQNTVPTTKVTYALLPVGTGNDWIKTHGIPKKQEEWLKMMQEGHTLVQDIGVATYTEQDQKKVRYFANIAGMAYDAYLVKNIEAKKNRITGSIIYILFLLVYLLKYRLTKAKVSFDQQVIEQYYYTINVGICRYSGGGMQIVPHAKPDDGWLAVTLAGKLSKLKVILNTFRLYNGTIGKLKEIDTYLTKEIHIEAPATTPCLIEADGEFLGQTPVSISILSKALRIIVPRPA